MSNIAIRQKSKIWFNATIQFSIQDILGVHKNIGSLRCGGGGGRVHEGHIWCAAYTIQYNTIQILFASSTHKNIHLLHINNLFYTIIDDAGGI